MKRLIPALWLVSNLAIGTAWAQPYAPNDMGVTMTPATRPSMSCWPTAACPPTRSGRIVLHVFGAATPHPGTALRPGVHRPATGRALAGRRRGPPGRPRLPARQGPGRVRRHRGRPGRAVRVAAGARAHRVRGPPGRATCSTRGRRSSAPCAASPGRRWPGTWRAAGPPWPRSQRSGCDVLAATPRPRKRRVAAELLRAYVIGEVSVARRERPRRLPALRRDHLVPGQELLLRHPAAATGQAARAGRRLRLRPPHRRHRGRHAARPGEAGRAGGGAGRAVRPHRRAVPTTATRC